MKKLIKKKQTKTNKRHKPVTNEEKEKKFESTELTRQIRLTRQT
jgi:hypothetical protein